ncbi:MAG: hypothetical protein K0S78_1324 [Thermomicrobiales bacterium]|nr:hypothetical protein [Thermomicrobiales bacterium]MDF3039468.1 hypothetical protein [Thermomicrobiales bacterium]
MHNGNGHGMRHGNGHGNGKRWLLIGLLILGGFWLVSDAYSDGFRDALAQTGQTSSSRFYRGGPDFPWEVLILGGIGYVAWRKGAFDRLSGPGGPFGPGGNVERGVQRYGDAGQGAGMVFRGPRALFEDWHREAHEAERARYAAPPAPRPTSPPAPAADPSGNGVPGGGYTPTPPPPPPAPDYWASMTRGADAAADTGQASAPTAAPPAAPNADSDASRGATGPALERW